MNGKNNLADIDDRLGGRFTDVTDSLLPLFADPDGRGSRRWREVFGLERSAPPMRGGLYFTVHVRRKRSSD